MNAAERIVDSYFRLVLGCFTLADRKVRKGNNRQLDILAYHLRDRASYHIEVGVTHRENWCPDFSELTPLFEKKFFGAPPERSGKISGTTDFEKKKNYWSQIEATYDEVGFDTTTVKRIWVCWVVKDGENNKPMKIEHHSNCLGRDFEIEVLSLRDYVLPLLEKEIGTSNYDDEILRVLGFMKQRAEQTADTPKAEE